MSHDTGVAALGICRRALRAARCRSARRPGAAFGAAGQPRPGKAKAAAHRSGGRRARTETWTCSSATCTATVIPLGSASPPLPAPRAAPGAHRARCYAGRRSAKHGGHVAASRQGTLDICTADPARARVPGWSGRSIRWSDRDGAGGHTDGEWAGSYPPRGGSEGECLSPHGQWGQAHLGPPSLTAPWCGRLQGRAEEIAVCDSVADTKVVYFGSTLVSFLNYTVQLVYKLYNISCISCTV
jgi:hypothetical protein